MTTKTVNYADLQNLRLFIKNKDFQQQIKDDIQFVKAVFVYCNKSLAEIEKIKEFTVEVDLIGNKYICFENLRINVFWQLGHPHFTDSVEVLSEGVWYTFNLQTNTVYLKN